MLSSVATSSANVVSSDSPDPVPVAATLGCADGETRQPEKRAQGLEGACAGVAGGIGGTGNGRRNPVLM